MLGKFESYLEINEIDNIDNMMRAAVLIEAAPEKQLYVYSRYGYLYEGFHKLLNGEISLEKFFTLGDITSKFKTSNSNLVLEGLFQVYENINNYENSIIIIEQKSYDFFHNKTNIDFEQLNSILDQKNSSIVMI